MSIFKKDSTDSNSSGATDSAKGTIAGLFSSISGLNRTKGVSPISLVGRNGERESPGFTPNESYVSNLGNKSKAAGHSSDTWFGVLLTNHPDYSGDIDSKFKSLSTNERFEQSKVYPNFKDNLKDPYQYYTTRDYYNLFNDASTDYFKHGLYEYTPLKSGKNDREVWDGKEESPLRLAQFRSTPYENNDPVLFGFEIVIDAISSPLLNGSVEDFIEQFKMVSEVGSRRYVIADFKEQFSKLFKTKGKITRDQGVNQIKTAIKNDKISDDKQTNIYQPGKNAYLSYYLKKISGLEMLIESNTPSKKKYLTNYREDVLRLTFSEDVSLSMGTLAHLYKLLYWSKPNGKNIVPENILRFNCDIIISEVRNLNRVRKAIDTGDLEVVKDNVSRHIYSLKECQFYFDQPAHDNEIDLSQPTKDFEQFVVTMDYKYVTSKFERWIPADNGFGQYAGYNNGAMWKVGNPNSRDTFEYNKGMLIAKGASTENAGTLNDNSIPKFFTTDTNTLKHNGVKAPIVLESYSKTGAVEAIKNANSGTSAGTNPSDDGEGPNETSNTASKSGNRSPKEKTDFENFKDNAKKASKKLAKNLEKAAVKELKGQVNARLRLLNNTLDKLRNNAGIGRMREPTNVYKTYDNALGISSGFFFDVHNSLRDFAGDSVGGVLGGVLRGGNNTTLF
jgi:hypothetical protein